MSDTFAYQRTPKSWKVKLIHLPMASRCIVYALMAIILTRPQTYNTWDSKDIEDIGIMLTMDASASMLAEDVFPNYMEVAKEVASEFISSRSSDSIGLTIFAGEAFIQCPMTLDHAALLNLLHNVYTDLVTNGSMQDDTAIGLGLVNSVNRLKDSKAKGKAVILLADGGSNVGSISPMTAATITKRFDIRVYTIGLGRETGEDVGAIDYKALQDIMVLTSSKFYRIQSRAELSKIYQNTGKLEKTRMNIKSYDHLHEAYMPFAWLVLLLSCFELIFRWIVFRRSP